jgi:hypothetical protein
LYFHITPTASLQLNNATIHFKQQQTTTATQRLTKQSAPCSTKTKNNNYCRLTIQQARPFQEENRNRRPPIRPISSTNTNQRHPPNNNNAARQNPSTSAQQILYATTVKD